jgi:hypothetical protein
MSTRRTEALHERDGFPLGLVTRMECLLAATRDETFTPSTRASGYEVAQQRVKRKSRRWDIVSKAGQAHVVEGLKWCPSGLVESCEEAFPQDGEQVPRRETVEAWRFQSVRRR